MFEYESIPSPNGHESMTRPTPLKYGLETESRVLQHCLPINHHRRESHDISTQTIFTLGSNSLSVHCNSQMVKEDSVTHRCIVFCFFFGADSILQDIWNLPSPKTQKVVALEFKAMFATIKYDWICGFNSLFGWQWVA